MATGTAAGIVIAAEIDADILLEEAEGIVAAEYAILRHLVEEREEERPQNPVRVRNYAEVTVPLYSQDEFKKHFRMHRETVEVSWCNNKIVKYSDDVILIGQSYDRHVS